MLTYPNVARIAPLAEIAAWDDPPLLVPFRFETPLGEVSLFTTLTTFGTPLDVTIDEIASSCSSPPTMPATPAALGQRRPSRLVTVPRSAGLFDERGGPGLGYRRSSEMRPAARMATISRPRVKVVAGRIADQATGAPRSPPLSARAFVNSGSPRERQFTNAVGGVGRS